MFLFSFFKAENKSENRTEHNKKRKIITALIIGGAALLVLSVAWAVYALNHVPSKAYCEEIGEYSLVASSEYEREQFFSQFGYNAESVEHTTVTVPSQGEVFEEYNELQEEQGLDMEPFMGKQANQYILRLNKTDESTAQLYGVLTVYRDRVIAVHLTDFVYSGAVRGLCD